MSMISKYTVLDYCCVHSKSHLKLGLDDDMSFSAMIGSGYCSILSFEIILIHLYKKY